MNKFDLIEMLTACLESELCETCRFKREGQPGCGTMVDEMTYNTQRELLDLLLDDVNSEKNQNDRHEAEIEAKDKTIEHLKTILNSRGWYVPETHITVNDKTASMKYVDESAMSGIIRDIRQRVNDPATICSYSETTAQDGMRTVSITISTDWTKDGAGDE